MEADDNDRGGACAKSFYARASLPTSACTTTRSYKITHPTRIYAHAIGSGGQSNARMTFNLAQEKVAVVVVVVLQV